MMMSRVKLQSAGVSRRGADPRLPAQSNDSQGLSSVPQGARVRVSISHGGRDKLQGLLVHTGGFCLGWYSAGGAVVRGSTSGRVPKALKHGGRGAPPCEVVRLQRRRFLSGWNRGNGH
jgi:hypothetical protein